MSNIIFKIFRYNLYIINKFLVKIFDLKLFYLGDSIVETKIKEIKKKNNFNEQKKDFELLLEKFSENPFVIEEYSLFLQVNNKNFYYPLKNYTNARNEWLKKNKLNHLNLNLIPWQVFCGSLGNCFNAYLLIEAILNHLSDYKDITFVNVNNKELTNPSLFKYFKKYIKVVEDKFLGERISSLEKYFKLPLDYAAIPLSDGCNSAEFVSNLITQEKIKNKKNYPLFKLSLEDEIRGKNEIKTFFGLKEDDWFVTVHVRSVRTKNDGKTESFRSSDINKYIKSMKLITKSGGYVFRMGNPKMEKIPKIKGVIDYANHEKRSDFLDVYLAAKSKFHLGTASGYIVIPDMFGVPYLLSETTQSLVLFTLKNHDSYLPRLILDNKTGKKISFRNLLMPEFSAINYDVLNFFKNKNYSIIENTEEDLVDATDELIKKNINNSKTTNLIATGDLQKKYIKIINEVAEKFYSEKIVIFTAPPEKFLERNIDLLS